jgi:single stranded DNA-binding protein
MKNLQLIGTVLRDAEYRSPKNGKQFLAFDVSVSNGKNQDGTWKQSDIFNCMMNEKQAEKIAQYIVKGIKIYVSGNPNVRAYTAKDNSLRATTSLGVDKIELLGAKQEVQTDGDNYVLPESGNVDAESLNSVPF